MKQKKLNAAERMVADGVLHKHLESGVVKVERSEYIGIASDGTRVNLGDTDLRFRDSVYSYLLTHPSPGQW